MKLEDLKDSFDNHLKSITDEQFDIELKETGIESYPEMTLCESFVMFSNNDAESWLYKSEEIYSFYQDRIPIKFEIKVA